MLVKVTAEIICDVVFAVGKTACATEAVHNRARLAADTAFYFFAVNRTYTLGDRLTAVDHADLDVLSHINKFICHKNAACACADDNNVVIFFHYKIA